MRRQYKGRTDAMVKSQEGEQGFWPSYADMMSAVALILFFLIENDLSVVIDTVSIRRRLRLSSQRSSRWSKNRRKSLHRNRLSRNRSFRRLPEPATSPGRLLPARW